MEKILNFLNINPYGTRQETLEKLNSIEVLNNEIINRIYAEVIGLHGSSLEFELTVLEFVYYHKFVKPALRQAEDLTREEGKATIKNSLSAFYNAFKIEVNDINENIDSISCINDFGDEQDKEIWEKYMVPQKVKVLTNNNNNKQ